MSVPPCDRPVWPPPDSNKNFKYLSYFNEILLSLVQGKLLVYVYILWIACSNMHASVVLYGLSVVIQSRCKETGFKSASTPHATIINIIIVVGGCSDAARWPATYFIIPYRSLKLLPKTKSSTLRSAAHAAGWLAECWG